MDNLGSLVVDDFSGGMTDFIVGGPTNQYEVAQNFNIDENRDLMTRPGSRPKFDYRITSTEVPRVIIPYLNEFLVQAESKVYRMGSTSATAVNLVGETYAIKDADQHTKVFQNFWNGNVILTVDDLSSPLKLWKDDSGNYRIEKLGLPYILLPYLIRLANDIKTEFNAHIVDLTEHSSSGIADEATLPDATDLDSLLELTNELLEKYESHLSNTGIHPGAIDQDQRLDRKEIQTIFGAAKALSELKTKYNLHDNDGTAHSNGAGGNVVTEKSTVNELISSAGGIGNSYLYALHFRYTYRTEDKTFVENSDVLYLEADNVGAPDAHNITITLPELTALEGYNVSDIRVGIFRTFDGGQTFFQVGDVPASQATFVDNRSDTDIENGAPLYVEGGILPDEPAPKCKYSVIVNDIVVLGHIKDGVRELPNFVQISKQARPYSFPNTFRVEFENDVVGLGYINTYPIVFLQDKLYRLEVSLDSFGRGFTRRRLISDAIGAINHESIVNTKIGVFFAGADGFYFTDGFNAKRISTDINRTFIGLRDKSEITGCYDNLLNRVMWSVKRVVREAINDFNDTIFVAHLDYPTPKDGFAFTFYNGGNSPTNFLVSGLDYDSFGDANNLLRLDPRGYLLFHSDEFFDDVFVSTLKDPEDWDKETIIYRFDSMAYDFGEPRKRKWVPKLNINAQNQSTVSLLLESSNDNTGAYEPMVPVIDNSNIAWGDPTIPWGDPTALWNLLPIISHWRHFPATRQGIRCMYKQVRLTNAFVEIENSNDLGPVSINAVTGVVTLLSHPAKVWLDQAINYFIAFEHENYEFNYLITNISGADITINDSANTLTPSSSALWKIRGFKKGDILNLSNFALAYAPITMTQTPPGVTA
jgi:hypothetical protein